MYHKDKIRGVCRFFKDQLNHVCWFLKNISLRIATVVFMNFWRNFLMKDRDNFIDFLRIFCKDKLNHIRGLITNRFRGTQRSYSFFLTNICFRVGRIILVTCFEFFAKILWVFVCFEFFFFWELQKKIKFWLRFSQGSANRIRGFF